jgi:flagellar hook-associated protein 1
LAQSVNGQIISNVEQINSYAVQIAELNQQIVAAESAYGQPPNDLYDQRDQLITDLNKLVKVTAMQDSNGSYNVFVGSGQQLVVGAISNSLVATASSADLSRIVVGMRTVGGNVQELPEGLLTGGQLGGLLSFRAEALDSAFNKLGVVAANMALTFNAQHGLGQDLLGNIAGDANFVADFFTVQPPRVIGNSNNNVASPSVSAAFTTPPPFNGTNFYTDLTSSDYNLAYDGANFTLTRLSDNNTWSGATIGDINTALAADPQGFSLSASAGAFTAGDSFLIQPTREAARNIDVDTRISSDPRLVAAATPVRTSGTINNAGDAKVTNPSVGLGYSVNGLPLTITFSGGDLTGFPAGTLTVTTGAGAVNYAIAGPATTVPYVSGARYSFSAATPATDPSEFAFDMAGTPANGDTYTITRNNGGLGVSDGSNALLLGKLQSQKTAMGGTANYQGAYAQLVSDNGNKTREIQVTSKAQVALLNQSESARDSLSGVNLDEEAANLIRYQQAYQASAKALEIGGRLLDIILAI